MAQKGIQRLRTAVDVLGDQGPLKEFCLFRSGVNASENGDWIFDPSNPDNAFARYLNRGVDVMIDLEHLSIDPEAPHFDPDARGWCKLELRGTELWAVDVRWTEDGLARLTSKRQRYISPAFSGNDDGEVGTILNIALVANPATHNTPALIAASASASTKGKKITMATDSKTPGDDNSGANDDDDLAALAKFMGLKPPYSFQACMAAFAAAQAAANGAPPPDTETDPGEEMAMDPPPPAKPGDKPAKPSPMQNAMARRQLLRVTGKTGAGDAIKEIETWKAAYVELEADKAKLAVEQAALDLTKRIGLAQALVKMGKETPATSGLNTLRVENGKTIVALSAHLASMPLVDLEGRVKAFGGDAPPPPARPRGTKPATDGTEEELPELTPVQLRAAKKNKIEPIEYQRYLAKQGGKKEASNG